MSESERSSAIPGIRSQRITFDKSMKKKKLLLIGASNVGKTALVNAYTKGKHSQSSVEPSVINEIDLRVDSKQGFDIMLSICDTTGKDDYSDFIHLSFKGSEVVLACFAINDPLSLLELEEKFLPILSKFLKSTYLILVGCKADLRSQNIHSVSFTQAWRFARRVGALTYIETSSMRGLGYNQVFSQAINLFTFKSTKAPPHKENFDDDDEEQSRLGTCMII